MSDAPKATPNDIESAAGGVLGRADAIARRIEILVLAKRLDAIAGRMREREDYEASVEAAIDGATTAEEPRMASVEAGRDRGAQAGRLAFEGRREEAMSAEMEREKLELLSVCRGDLAAARLAWDWIKHTAPTPDAASAASSPVYADAWDVRCNEAVPSGCGWVPHVAVRWTEEEAQALASHWAAFPRRSGIEVVKTRHRACGT